MTETGNGFNDKLILVTDRECSFRKKGVEVLFERYQSRKLIVYFYDELNYEML